MSLPWHVSAYGGAGGRVRQENEEWTSQASRMGMAVRARMGVFPQFVAAGPEAEDPSPRASLRGVAGSVRSTLEDRRTWFASSL